MQAFQAQGIEADDPLEKALRGLIAAGMGAMQHGPELFRALEAVPGRAFTRQLDGARVLVIGLVRQLLEMHRDELRVADIDLAAFIVVSAIEGVAANATSMDFDERLAEELTSLVMRYLANSRDSSGALV